MIKRILSNDFIRLLFYLGIAVLLVYFIPAPLNKAIFLIVIPLVWFSKKDYFWLAFFLILIDQPGGLFSGGTRADLVRLPLYIISSEISFSITELYLICLFIKVLTKSYLKNKKPYVYFNKELLLLAYFFIFLVFVSFFLGASFTSLNKTYKTIINLTLVYSLFFIITDRNDFISFARIIFPFVFVALLLQSYSLIYHKQLIETLKPGATTLLLNTSGKSGDMERPIEMVSTLFICFISGLYLIGIKRSPFKKWYLSIIITVSFFSIFLTGTRSWTIGFLCAFLFFIYQMKNELTRSIFRFVFGIFFILLVLTIIPSTNKQFIRAANRISTVKGIVKGDITMGGTAGRYEYRAPSVMRSFLNSTIVIGAAFSDYFYLNYDVHVGYHSLLLNTGILGIFLWAMFYLKLFKPVLSKSNQINPFVKLGLLPIIAIMVINTGVQTIGYSVIHTGFYIIQSFSYAFLVMAYNNSSEGTTGLMNSNNFAANSFKELQVHPY